MRKLFIMEKPLNTDGKTMTNKKTIQWGARLPIEIYEAIEAYRKKAKMSWRTDALIDMIKIACAATNIQIGKILGSKISAERPAKLEKPKPALTAQTQTSVETKKIGCPDKDSWVAKEDCDKCRGTQFNVWSGCYNERRRNPNNPIFKPTEKLKS